MVENNRDFSLEKEVVDTLQKLHEWRKSGLRSGLELVQERFPEVVADATTLLTAAREDSVYYAQGAIYVLTLHSTEREDEPIEIKNRALYQELGNKYLSGERPLSNPLAHILDATLLMMVELEKLEEKAEV